MPVSSSHGYRIAIRLLVQSCLQSCLLKVFKSTRSGIIAGLCSWPSYQGYLKYLNWDREKKFCSPLCVLFNDQCGEQSRYSTTISCQLFPNQSCCQSPGCLALWNSCPDCGWQEKYCWKNTLFNPGVHNQSLPVWKPESVNRAILYPSAFLILTSMSSRILQ